MKKRIVKVLLAVTVGIALVSCNTIKTADNTAYNDNYINADNITSYWGTADGLQLNFTDGTAYYFEIPQETDSRTEVFYIYSENDFDSLIKTLETRNGKIIIEISSGTVIDDDGNGQDICGNYIKYDPDRFSAGDHVQSIFVYNPETNFIDDIISRTDTLIP